MNVEQPVASPEQKGDLGQRRRRRDAARARHPVHRAQSRRELSAGLHDSLVNYLGNARPQMLLCVHEENAVAIAHGYAKASDRMMAAVVHANVGLMHATMAIFNAWCDRMPVLLLGATGPWDAAKRRPWIDWIHTAADQGALIRDYTKWDNQPASVPAAYEALLRAAQIAQDRAARSGLREPRRGDAGGEDRRAAAAARPGALRARALARAAARARRAGGKAAVLGAKNPVMLAGRCSRSLEGWRQRVALAEKLQAPSLTDLKQRRRLPDRSCAARRRRPACSSARPAAQAIREADVILSLDWLDLAGTLKQAYGASRDPGEGDQRLLRHAPAPRLEHGLPGAAAGGRASS